MSKDASVLIKLRQKPCKVDIDSNIWTYPVFKTSIKAKKL